MKNSRKLLIVCALLVSTLFSLKAQNFTIKANVYHTTTIVKGKSIKSKVIAKKMDIDFFDSKIVFNYSVPYEYTILGSEMPVFKYGGESTTYNVMGSDYKTAIITAFKSERFNLVVVANENQIIQVFQETSEYKSLTESKSDNVKKVK